MKGLPGEDARINFFRLLKVCFFPGAKISFSEIVLTDALTSLSKVFKDLGVTCITLYCQFAGEEILEQHDTGMILIGLLASLPFWLRMRQCYVQLFSCPDFIAKIPPILNMLKYFSAFPPIWLTAAASLGYSVPNLSTYIFICASINSLYGIMWDIVMDWGLITLKRDMIFYARPAISLPVYVYIIVTLVNMVLRFSWLSTSFPYFSQYHSSVVILALELLEIFRRSVWNIFRIEWEVLVQQEKSYSAKPLISPKSSPIYKRQGQLL